MLGEISRIEHKEQKKVSSEICPATDPKGSLSELTNLLRKGRKSKDSKSMSIEEIKLEIKDPLALGTSLTSSRLVKPIVQDLDFYNSKINEEQVCKTGKFQVLQS